MGGLSHDEVQECTNICAQVRRGVDTNEVFTCLDGKVAGKITIAENAGNSVALEEALDAQIEQFAFFNTTLDPAAQASFSTVQFDQVSVADSGFNAVMNATNEGFVAFEADGSIQGVGRRAAIESGPFGVCHRLFVGRRRQ